MSIVDLSMESIENLLSKIPRPLIFGFGQSQISNLKLSDYFFLLVGLARRTATSTASSKFSTTIRALL